MDVFEHLVAVAAPLNKAAMKGHKYIKREADGHGGWYYTYQHKTLPAGPHVLHVIFDANGEAVEHKAFGVTPFQRLREHALNHANANRDTHADVKPKQAFRSPKPNLGISRAEMPQIRSFHREEFLRGLAAKGAGSTSEQIPANELSPTQKEIHADVVSKLQSGELVGAAEKPILVSSDGYILDGHHRWAQTLAGGKPTTALNAVRINMPIRKLLDAARAFAKVEYSKSTDALDALGALFKADGQMRAGHKYIRRERKAGGGYNYIYRDAQGRESKGEPQPTKDPAVGAEADPLEKTFEFVSLESLGLPEDTQKFWKSGDTYKPERNRLHEKAYSEEFDHVASVPKDKKPVVVVMMGAMSAGKGTVVDHLIGDNEDYVHVDPDRMKERLPEYKKAINAGTAPDGRKRAVKAAGTMAHEESSDMAEELRKRCIAGRKNFVLDGSGKNADKYGAKIKELKDAGYHVRLFMPHLEDLKEVNRRADNRGVKGGRFISKPLLEESHYVVPGNFEKLAPLSDDWALFDTSAEGHSPPPRAVWSSEGGKEKKIDPAFIERFQKTARERHAVSKERGWLKAWLERTLRKASAGKGLPPSSTLDEILGRFKKDRGETPDIDTGLEDSNDVAKARKQNEEGDNMKDDYAGPAQKPGTQAKPKPSANGPQKPGQKAQPGKPAASKGKPGEGPQKPTQYSTKTRGEDGEPMFAPQGDDERDPEAKFVVSDETPEGAHYENPKDSEHHDGFKQWKAARKQGLEGAAIPKHLVDAALQHTGKHHFDSDAHKLAYDDHLAHQEGSTGPKVPPSHASQKAGAKGKPKGKDPIDMVGKLAYEPSDEHVEGATPSGISRNGEEHETSGAAEKEDDDKYKKLYGAARKSVDPIDALAPLMKAAEGVAVGGKYTSRKADGKGGWIYEYTNQAQANAHGHEKDKAAALAADAHRSAHREEQSHRMLEHQQKKWQAAHGHRDPKGRKGVGGYPARPNTHADAHRAATHEDVNRVQDTLLSHPTEKMKRLEHEARATEKDHWSHRHSTVAGSKKPIGRDKSPTNWHTTGSGHKVAAPIAPEDEDRSDVLGDRWDKSFDPIDALAPLVKAESGPRAGHKYTSREPDGKGGWIYEYAKENPNLHTAKKPGAGSDSGEVASQRHYNVLKKIAREAADDSPEQDAAVQRHEKHAIEHKAKYGRAPDEHGGAAAHGGGKEAEAAAWRRIEQMAPGRARSVAMMQHYEKFDVPEGQIDTEDAEFDARPKGYNHLPTKKSFQQRGDTFDLRKGLYAFDLSNSTNTGTVPETLLGDYLASFIQEALEHEKREPAHRNPTAGENLYEYFATPILHELVQFIPRNENLARAAKKFKVTAEYIEAVMKDCGMIKPTTDAHKDHGDYWSSDWDSMSALGGDSARGPMQESLLASKQAPWVQPDPLATRSLRLAAEVSPLTMPERPPVVVRALPRVAPPAPMPTPNYDPGCLMHGDTGKMQMQHESFVRCSCH